MARQRTKPVKLHVDFDILGALRGKKNPCKARLRVDLIDGAVRAWRCAADAVARWRALGAPELAWDDVQPQTLVQTICDTAVRNADGVPAEAPAFAWLLLKSTDGLGMRVGSVTTGGVITIDEGVEHEPWSFLKRRHGTDRVKVIARRVPHDASPKTLHELVECALEDTSPKSPDGAT